MKDAGLHEFNRGVIEGFPFLKTTGYRGLMYDLRRVLFYRHLIREFARKLESLRVVEVYPLQRSELSRFDSIYF